MNLEAIRLSGAVPFSTQAMIARSGSCWASLVISSGVKLNSPACAGPSMYKAAFMLLGVPVQFLEDTSVLMN